MECVTCGGTDFFKDSGYFYCNECQTQSQEVREHVFQEEANDVNVKSTKKIKQSKPDKADNKITSWECYNIVMCSLTQQLINLGADRKLKPIVKYLWIRYLEKLEILNMKYDERPKLPLVNLKRDASILYTQMPKKKKRRRKSTSDETTTTLDTTSLKRARTKKKRALAQAQYDEFSQKSTGEISSTLHSETVTLTSLKSSSEKSASKERPTSFSRYSIKELRKKMTKRHCRRHKFDKQQTLKCHKFTYAGCSRQYRLIINKDKIQLGDLFRFIREGHLSFNNYTELLPPDYLNKFTSIQNNNKNGLFSNKLFRITTAKLAKFLDVVKYVEVVDITELCQRYCKELNLPGEVFLAVENLISKTSPKLIFTNEHKLIPNYEGRAMSLIIFALKLLFGLDGITESELSRYAQLVNSLEMDMPKMFDIVKWIEYIGYRSILLNEYHFPTAYDGCSNNVNSDLFLQYVNKSKNVTPDENITLTKEMTDYKRLLTKLQELEENAISGIEFPASFTPFLDYSKTNHLIKYDKKGLLRENFHNYSLDFLLRPNKYLELVGENIEIKHGGANDNWVIENLKSYRSEQLPTRNAFELVPIEIVGKGVEKDINPIYNRGTNQQNKKHDSQYVQTKYEECRQHIFHENKKYLARISKHMIFNNEANTEKLQCYNIHFNPYERYWLYLQMNIDVINKKFREDFFHKHSNAFKLIFKECARIIEQTTQEFLYDFQFCELFLVYAATYKDKSDKPKSRELLDINLQHYINQAVEYW